MGNSDLANIALEALFGRSDARLSSEVHQIAIPDAAADAHAEAIHHCALLALRAWLKQSKLNSLSFVIGKSTI